MSPAGALVRPMQPRDPNEAHRTSTVLELFFDLVFVVAVGSLVTEWHHSIGEGHVTAGLARYLIVFMGLWWAWMGFTWFANFFDVDDVPYRLLVLLIMLGSLAMAAGIPGAYENGDFRTMVTAYVVMRVAVVALWVRAGRASPELREYCLRWAVGIALCQADWVVFAFSRPSFAVAVPWFVLGQAVEMAVPAWAHRMPEARRPSTHPEHAEERYGLFTIIVLGEMVVIGANAFSQGLKDTSHLGATTTAGVCAAILAFALWWLYFDFLGEYDLSDVRTSFLWGYGHYLVFASLGAVGGALAALFDTITGGHAALPGWGQALTLAVPVAVFILLIAVLDLLCNDVARTRWFVAAGLVVAIGGAAGAASATLAVIAIAATTAAFLALEIVLRERRAAAVGTASSVVTG